MMRFTHLWHRLSANAFVRRLGVLLTGTALAQALPVLVSPVLTRLYTPAAFGEYALFTSGMNILSQLVCLKYDFAVLTARDNTEARLLLRLSVRLCVLLSVGLCTVLPFAGALAVQFGTDGMGWVLLLPAAACITGLHSAFTYWQMRQNGYRRITQAALLRAVITVLLQLLLSHLGRSGVALMASQLVGYTAAFLLLRGESPGHNRSKAGEASIAAATHPQSGSGQQWEQPGFAPKEPSSWQTQLARYRSVAREYAAFPCYTLPGALCNAAATGIASFFLSAYYSASELGCYSLVNRVLTAPLALLASSTGQVFAKELADARGGKAAKVFGRVSGLLALLSLPVFVLLFVFARPFVRVLFGPVWTEAADMLRLLLPLAAVRLVVSPVSATGIVLGRQRATLVWQVSLLLAALVPPLWHRVAGLNLYAYLLLQTVLLSGCYLVFWLYCAAAVRQEDGKRGRT